MTDQVFDGKSGLPDNVQREPGSLPGYMKLRKDCASTLTQCCLAIVKIYTTDSQSNFMNFLDAGGIEEVISTLRRYKSESRLQQAGLWLLWILAQQEELRTRIAAGSGAGVVITAMQTHPTGSMVHLLARCPTPP